MIELFTKMSEGSKKFLHFDIKFGLSVFRIGLINRYILTLIPLYLFTI
jgi:hypothetical protein